MITRADHKAAHFRARRTLAVVLGVFVLAPLSWCHTFFTISRDDGLLHIVEKGTLTTRRTLPISPAGATVTRCTAMAFDPVGDDLFVVADLQGQSGSYLLWVEPYSGEAIVRGAMGDAFAALAIDDSGTFWAVSDELATTPETLYTVDAATGATTMQLTLGGGAPGEALTYHPATAKLLRFTGDAPATAETIDPVTLARLPFVTSGASWSATTSAVWDAEANLFHITGSTRSFAMTAAGLVTDSGIDHDHRVHGQAAITCQGAWCGDCNRDGTGPNILDGLAVAQMSLGLISPMASQHICCDVNADFQLSVIDALLMAQWSTGLLVTLACPL